MLKKWGIALAVSAFCAHASAQTPGTQYDGMSLSTLQQMNYIEGSALAGEDPAMQKRIQAMRDAAMAVGAQHGYIKTMNELREQFNAETEAMDKMFPFKDLMRMATPGETSLYFLPPVIAESLEVTAHSNSNDMIKVSGQYYEIIKRERLVTAPPDWREYLLFDIPVDVSRPVGALLPKTPEEQQFWADWVAEGWEGGILQAHDEMNSRIRNLGSDIVGMVKYLRLVEGKQITPSYVAAQYRNAVTQGSKMHLNQKVFSITGRAEFNSRSDRWEPLNLDPRGSYRTPDEINSINGYGNE